MRLRWWTICTPCAALTCVVQPLPLQRKEASLLQLSYYRVALALILSHSFPSPLTKLTKKGSSPCGSRQMFDQRKDRYYMGEIRWWWLATSFWLWLHSDIHHSFNLFWAGALLSWFPANSTDAWHGIWAHQPVISCQHCDRALKQPTSHRVLVSLERPSLFVKFMPMYVCPRTS